MDSEIEKLLEIVKLSAQITLTNGGETYRAEQICEHICKALGYGNVEAMAITTGIFINITDNSHDHTVIGRIKKRTINLAKIEIVNNISRDISKGKLNMDEALELLRGIENQESLSMTKTAIVGGLSAGCFAAMFGGGLVEFIIAALSGVAVQLATASFGKLDSYQFFISIIGGMMTAFIAIGFTAILGVGDYNIIILGGIMPLLPGLAMTNAIRDTIRGDLISGTARGVEAVIVAASVAAGVGIIITCFITFGGVLL